MNMFELASRGKYRFSSAVGDLTAEQLWDLPLTAVRFGGIDLDHVAKSVNSELKAVTEESFVAPAKSALREELETKLEIVKHVIAYKLKLVEDRVAAQARDAKRRKILEALETKENLELTSASKEELLKQLEELA